MKEFLFGTVLKLHVSEKPRLKLLQFKKFQTSEKHILKSILMAAILLITFIVPTNVKAESKNYTIDKLNMNTRITDQGNVEVEEELTYTFHGDYNGIYRNLSKSGCKGYKVESVAVMDKNNNITSLAATNDSKDKTYQINDSNDNIQIKVFSKSNDETKTIIFKYNILGAVTKNNESGVLDWKFYKVENNMPIKEVNFQLSLKDSQFDLNKFKYHPYVDGEFTTNYDNHNIYLKGSNLTSALAIKVEFQPEFLSIPVTTNESNNSNNIINNESSKSNNSNNLGNRSNSNNMKVKSNEEDYGVLIFSIGIGAIIAVAIYINMRNNARFQEALKKYRATFDFFKEPVLDTPPSDISPALANFLYDERNISISSVHATLIYLSTKGYYALKENKYSESEAEDDEKIYGLCFKKTNLPMPTSIHLKYLMEWLALYEEDDAVSLKNIEKEVATQSGALKFKESFAEWKETIKKEAEELNFYTTIENRKVLSNETYNEKIKWNAYRRYLIEYFREEEISIASINEALMYGMALDIDELHSKAYSEKLNNFYESSGNMNDMTSDYLLYYTNISMWNNIDDSVQQNTTSDNSSIDNSSNNSSTDSGFTGFSSGGDSSGGGGGDSGAF